MAERREPRADERRRELAVARYVDALDRGDFAAVAAVLAEAAADPELDRRLVGVNAALHEEAGLPTFEEHAQTVRQLLWQHLPSAVDEPPAAPPLTVGVVAARIQGERAGQALSPSDRMANLRLASDETVLSGPFTPAVVARLATALGVEASERYWELFRRTAATLAIGRQRGEVALAAARRQGATRRAPKRRPGDRSGGRS